MARGPTISTTFNAIDKVTQPMQKMARNVKRFAAIGGTALVGGLAFGLRTVITEASKIEDATAGFTPLMGGVQKATDLVDALNQTAATTPFQFENISAAAKQLLPVMNQDINKTVESFRMLGDTAGGNAQKLDSITRGYTKSMLKGKVDMESLNMIAEAGVPIYSELASSLGVTVAEMMKMSSAGSIASEDLTDAFRKMTGEGGLFYRGMEIASQTMTGKWSTLKDNIALTAASIGKTLMPTIKPLLDKAIEMAGTIREWVDNNQDLIQQKFEEALKKIVNVAKTLWKLWDSGLIPALLAGIVAFRTLYPIVKSIVGAVKIWTEAQHTLNAVLMMNPVGLIVAAVAALIAVVVLAIKHFDEWGAAILMLMGPFGMLINAFMLIKRNWDSIKASFAEGGFLEGIKTIQAVLIQSVLKPIQQILELIEKIPGIGKLAGRLNEKVSGFMDSNQQFIDRDNPGLIGRNDAMASSHSEISKNDWYGELLVRAPPWNDDVFAWKRRTQNNT